MQKATRNTFTQKGAEIQKINQSGIWAYVESSYLNPDFDSACNGYETSDGEGKIVSVAKWIYRCKRLLKKSNHIAVSIDNGEVLEPCYLIEPSSDDRLQDNTLVWLEPLPQLNGYVIIPGGPSHCGEVYGYYGYGSENLGSSLLECEDLAKCLCVKKNDQGHVTGVFIKTKDIRLVEIRECQVSGSGYDLISCCPPDGKFYYWEYNLTILDYTYRGFTIPRGFYQNIFSLIFYVPPPPGFPCRQEDFWIWPVLGCDPNTNRFGASIAWGCAGDYYCEAPMFLNDEPLRVTVIGCPDYPTVRVDIPPGYCISGWLIARPYYGNENDGGVIGDCDGPGDGRCCPQLYSPYVFDYDVVVGGMHRRGTSNPKSWTPLRGNEISIVFDGLIDGPGCGLFGLWYSVVAKCKYDGTNFLDPNYPFLHTFRIQYVCGLFGVCEIQNADCDYWVFGCPSNPTICIRVKTGHPCVTAGTFRIRPV
jgi:hypothetical protein